MGMEKYSHKNFISIFENKLKTSSVQIEKLSIDIKMNKVTIALALVLGMVFLATADAADDAYDNRVFGTCRKGKNGCAYGRNTRVINRRSCERMCYNKGGFGNSVACGKKSDCASSCLIYERSSFDQYNCVDCTGVHTGDGSKCLYTD